MSRVIFVIGVLLFSYFKCTAQLHLIFADSLSKNPVEYLVLQSMQNDFAQFVVSSDSIELAKLGNSVLVSHLTYEDKIINAFNYSSGDTIWLLPKLNHLQSVEIAASRLDVVNLINAALKNRYKENEHRLARMFYRTVVDGHLTEQGEVLSVDQVSKDGIGLKSRECINYRFDVEAIFFNLDIDLFVRQVVSKAFPTKNILSRNRVRGSEVLLVLDRCWESGDTEMCNIRYTMLDSSARGQVNIDIDKAAILKHHFTLYQMPAPSNLNEELPSVVDSIVIEASLDDKGFYEQINFVAYYSLQKRTGSIAQVATTGVIKYSSIEKQPLQQKLIVPQAVSYSIQEALKYTVRKDIGIITTFPHWTEKNSLAEHDSLANAILSYFDYGKQTVAWSADRFLESGNIGMHTDMLNIPQGEFPANYFDFDVYWCYYLDFENLVVESQPSLWDVSAAHFVSPSKKESVVLGNFIFDYLELARQKVDKELALKIENGEKSAKSVQDYVFAAYQKAKKECLQVISKCRYGSDFGQLRREYKQLSEGLGNSRDLMHLLLSTELESKYSFADLLLSAGYQEKAISAYLTQIANTADSISLANTYHNLAIAYLNNGQKVFADKYYSLAIKTNPDLKINNKLVRRLERQ